MSTPMGSAFLQSHFRPEVATSEKSESESAGSNVIKRPRFVPSSFDFTVLPTELQYRVVKAMPVESVVSLQQAFQSKPDNEVYLREGYLERFKFAELLPSDRLHKFEQAAIEVLYAARNGIYIKSVGPFLQKKASAVCKIAICSALIEEKKLLNPKKNQYLSLQDEASRFTTIVKGCSVERCFLAGNKVGLKTDEGLVIWQLKHSGILAPVIKFPVDAGRLDIQWIHELPNHRIVTASIQQMIVWNIQTSPPTRIHTRNFEEGREIKIFHCSEKLSLYSSVSKTALMGMPLSLLTTVTTLQNLIMDQLFLRMAAWLATNI